MEQKKQTQDFKPTKAEIRAINHYWEEAMRNAKGAKNRAQRRKNHARG